MHNTQHNIASAADHSVAGLQDGYLRVQNGSISTGTPSAQVAILETQLNLPVAGWVESSGGWEITVNCANNGLGVVGLPPGATDAEYAACRDAEVRISTRTASTISFRAMNQPTAAIVLMYREEQVS